MQLTTNNEKCRDFSLAFVPADSVNINFSESEVDEGKLQRGFSLIGYSIGKKLFYGSLLDVVKRTRNFKGDLEILSLEGVFSL